MVQYYVLIKDKRAKEWQKAIPAVRSAKLAMLRMRAKQQFSPKYRWRIVSDSELQRLRKRLMPMKTTKRKVKCKKRKMVRKVKSKRRMKRKR